MRGEANSSNRMYHIESVNRRTTIADSPYTHLDTASWSHPWLVGCRQVSASPKLCVTAHSKSSTRDPLSKNYRNLNNVWTLGLDSFDLVHILRRWSMALRRNLSHIWCCQFWGTWGLHRVEAGVRTWTWVYRYRTRPRTVWKGFNEQGLRWCRITREPFFPLSSLNSNFLSHSTGVWLTR